MQAKNPQPLVSIIVFTYNSAKFVVETLESVKAQTYHNIELVVSDDCSTDNTVLVCEAWIKKNESRFVKTTLVTAKKNKGLPANCNQGIQASVGEWIKIVAGDDLLPVGCIQLNVDFTFKKKDAKVIFSKRVSFSGEASNMKIIVVSKSSLFNNKNITSQQQYQLALRNIKCPTNTLFYKRSILNEVGGFDEQFPFYEDWPMLLKLTKAGFKYHFMDEETFFYRIHQDSVYHKGAKKFTYKEWDLKSWIPVYKKYVLPDITFRERINFYYRCVIMHTFYFTPLNSRNILTRIIHKCLLFPVSLHRKMVVKSLNKKLNKEILSKSSKISFK